MLVGYFVFFLWLVVSFLAHRTIEGALKTKNVLTYYFSEEREMNKEVGVEMKIKKKKTAMRVERTREKAMRAAHEHVRDLSAKDNAHLQLKSGPRRRPGPKMNRKAGESRSQEK